MKRNILCMVLVMGTIFNHAFAQSKPVELRIGDVVPDIEFKVLNHSSSTTKLSDYKGKIIILDFWATFCGPCIKKFPHLDSLQKENEDIVKIITIGRDNLKDKPNKISDFLQRYLKKHQDFKLPIAYNDSIAVKYFPHQEISHFVWIDQNGKLLATTNGDEMSTEMIKKVYRGEEVNFEIKKDLMKFKKNLPLFADEDNGGKERNVKYKSLITGYISGLPGSYYTDLDKNGLATKMYIRDITLLTLFKQAYNCFLPKSQIILDVKNRGKFIEDPTDKTWAKQNKYSYELTTAPAKMEKLYRLFQHDLYAYFGMRAKVEKRKVKCYEIIRSVGRNTISNRKSRYNICDGKDIGEILTLLNQYGKLPTFYTEGIESEPMLFDIDDKGIDNPRLLKNALNEKGFDIIETEKELEMFVINEVDE